MQVAIFDEFPIVYVGSCMHNLTSCQVKGDHSAGLLDSSSGNSSESIDWNLFQLPFHKLTLLCW